MSQPPLGEPAELFEALQHLAETIDARADAPDADQSYTAQLLAGGPRKVSEKIIEEAGELAAALLGEPDENVASEAGDLLYHLLVGLRTRGVTLEDVGKALKLRQGMSGLEEKASR